MLTKTLNVTGALKKGGKMFNKTKYLSLLLLFAVAVAIACAKKQMVQGGKEAPAIAGATATEQVQTPSGLVQDEKIYSPPAMRDTCIKGEIFFEEPPTLDKWCKVRVRVKAEMNLDSAQVRIKIYPGWERDTKELPTPYTIRKWKGPIRKGDTYRTLFKVKPVLVGCLEVRVEFGGLKSSYYNERTGTIEPYHLPVPPFHLCCTFDDSGKLIFMGTSEELSRLLAPFDDTKEYYERKSRWWPSPHPRPTGQ
ncbi:MAG: hypothetical protein AB1393_04550 [Candidatus Edwardsbacteria bacterium]